jgi:hypothetical protein
MPTTIADIKAAMNAALNIVDQEIKDALAKQNAAANDAAASKFDGPIHQLMTQRIAIYGQAADAVLKSGEMTAALNTLRGLTSDMNTIAVRMGSVTGFFQNVASFLEAASKVTGVGAKGAGA